MAQSDRILLTEKEAAQMLRCSPITLRKWRWQRLPPPFIKIGRNVVYDKEDIDKFINDSYSKRN